MKAIKFFALLAAAAAFTFAFTACDNEAEDGDVPTTKTEARQMLVGTWKAAAFLSYLHDTGNDFDEYYRDIAISGTTGKFTLIGHVSKYATSTKWKPYADKYVISHQYTITAITIDDADPTTGSITYTKDGKSETMAFKRLTSTSVVFEEDGEYRSAKKSLNMSTVVDPSK